MKILRQNVLKISNLLGEISSNWPNDILETNVYETLALLLTILQWTSTTSASSK